MFIECPTPAYRRIVNSGLEKKILANRERVKDLISGAYLQDNYQLRLLIKWANQQSSKQGKITERTLLARQFQELGVEAEEDKFFCDKRGILQRNPDVLAFTALTTDIFAYEKYGFSSRSQMAESITSYCLGENQVIAEYGHDYVWRNNDHKNCISQNIHGDLHASQTDVSGRDTLVQTLFGPIAEFDTIKVDPPRGSINQYQDWSTFLITLLKYAQVIGKEKMPEIALWRAVLDQTGFVGTNTAEALGGMGGMDPVPFLMNYPILTAHEPNTEYFPLTMSHEEIRYLPYVEDERLVLLQHNPEGDFKISQEAKQLTKEERYSPQIVYTPQDLPHCLSATYKFFARDRSLLPRIMNAFIKETNK